MIAGHPFGACVSTFGNCADRFCLGGYGGATTLREMLDLAQKVEGLDGIELLGNWHINDKSLSDVARLLSDRGFTLCMLTADLWTQAKWGKGSLAAADAKTREAAVDVVKKTMDWASQAGCRHVNVWPGQDGFDYCFQADYIETWKRLTDGLALCAGHNEDVRLLVEYKAKEPRTHCFVNSAAKALLLLKDIDQVGVILDWGHSLQTGENVAEAAALINSFGKLDYLHLNDNWRSWDDDMMVGSVHLIEYLELVYWLKRLDYKGWLTLDIFPYREDGVQAAEQSRKWLEGLFAAVDRVGMDAFAEAIERGDACNALDVVRRALNL